MSRGSVGPRLGLGLGGLELPQLLHELPLLQVRGGEGGRRGLLRRLRGKGSVGSVGSVESGAWMGVKWAAGCGVWGGKGVLRPAAGVTDKMHWLSNLAGTCSCLRSLSDHL